MEEILKQEKSKSYKEFAEDLEIDLKKRVFTEGQIATGTIEEVSKRYVLLDLGLKSSAAIPIDEFKLTKQMDKIKPGEKIDVLLEKTESARSGEVVASYEKGRRAKLWSSMEASFKAGKTVSGMIVQKCRGGMVVDAGGCLMFLPGSQIALRASKDYSSLMKIPLEFAIVKMDKKRGNLVCSRRAVLESARDKDKDALISKLKEGSVVQGVVKNMTDWGAFVDIAGGLDALLHITDISWSRIDKPSDLLSIGQTIKVKITRIEPGTKKISCSIKDLTESPWLNAVEKYKVGARHDGTITKVTEYGVFCKLDDSIEGLIHSSQLSWTKKNIHPGKILSTSQKIVCEILSVDKEKKRISLSYRNCLENPWVTFAKNIKINDTLEGVVKSVVDYGLFISINDKDGKPTQLDGLCHFKDVHYDEQESHLKNYEKNKKIKFKILEFDQEAEKIRLGIKQLESDSFGFFTNKKIGETVTLTVSGTSMNGIYAYAGPKKFSILIKKNQLAKEIENQRPSRFVRGDKVDAIITELNKEKRIVSLSIKKLEEKQVAAVVKKWGSKDSGGVLGDILGKALNLRKKKDPKSEE